MEDVEWLAKGRAMVLGLWARHFEANDGECELAGRYCGKASTKNKLVNLLKRECKFDISFQGAVSHFYFTKTCFR